LSTRCPVAPYDMTQFPAFHSAGDARRRLRRVFHIPLRSTIFLAIIFALSASWDKAQAQTTPQTYEIGSTIRFDEKGNSAAYRRSGWSQQESDHVWTDTNSATLDLLIKGDVAGPLELHTVAEGLRHEPDLPSQEVQVYANGTQVGTWQVGAKSDYSVTLPPAVTATNKPLHIEFRIPHATSPKKLGLGDDLRTLGIALFELRLQPGKP
jgi:hypothetical protein